MSLTADNSSNIPAAIDLMIACASNTVRPRSRSTAPKFLQAPQNPSISTTPDSNKGRQTNVCALNRGLRGLETQTNVLVPSPASLSDTALRGADLLGGEDVRLLLESALGLDGKFGGHFCCSSFGETGRVSGGAAGGVELGVGVDSSVVALDSRDAAARLRVSVGEQGHGDL